MPTAAELKTAMDMANVQVAALEKQLMEAADREANEAKAAQVGS